MMLWKTATLLALSCCASGCKNFLRNETVLIGGERVMFYRAGTAVPAVSAEVNTNGWYSLSTDEMKAIMAL